MTATNLDRIDALEQRLAALKGAPPRRDPASTASMQTAIRSVPREAPATAQAFGFTPSSTAGPPDFDAPVL